ncbi:pyrroline-5-carboxylate reductase [Aggregatibacter actinomycetemcomitans]|uniref:pyrroline-5-carboxylate reductase n=1 Tax=Aggregatibacter actinomycetemcomitans TaxID=714 RepID=UPI00197B88CB|nr:pyrroline-5-carboxylate reductase [Aggregatibacter actinomycetemcomitans]MBN6063133.1 pyrroline-5-carboxylate reductase [Aggregatibacter actinomycetemcomitans]MBN6080613.1 pyrroline-5-carboxylate reductase [Aggregatibacter actinomycetemcomitans]MBN6083028.1 pyrroline-5-carboxylate reductase [Aggregatibacter actinomycetemcomitans]
MQHKLVTFIGGGNMAQAIVFGLLKRGYPADKIIVCDPNEEKRDLFAQKGVRTAMDNVAAAAQADVVLLAVKPQMLADVCAPLSAVDFQRKLVISIAAAISLARLTALLPSAQSIVRVMPNTPALVGEGMAGLFAAKNTSENDRTFAQDLLSAVGKTLWLDSEEQMHAVTAASGSSPAYFFQLLEAMQQGLQQMGLNEQQARELVQQAMLGSAKMVVENPQLELAILRQNVTSKGGTTAAALNVFNQHQFNDIVQQAMQACVARSKEMEILF